jgi:hypothetical protein
MATLVLVALAGFVASFVDGALGMGFGPTSSTILLASGLTPAAVSTTVNLAKVVTGTAGGAAHWRFGNVDRRLVLQLAGPGAVGAVIGVTVLANVDGDRLRPYLSGLLLVVGLRILLRFGRLAAAPPAPPVPRVPATATAVTAVTAASAATTGRGRRGGRSLALAGFAGGITNGMIGTWGPVVTPVLLSRKEIEPRVAIGSVNTAEVAVACAASGSLIASLGAGGLDVGIVVAMLVGGTLAAPVAAWAVRHVAPAMLGVGAGGLLVLTSVRDLAGTAGLGPARWPAYAAIVVTCLLALRAHRVRRRTTVPAPTLASPQAADPGPVHGPPAPASLA